MIRVISEERVVKVVNTANKLIDEATAKNSPLSFQEKVETISKLCLAIYHIVQAQRVPE